MDKSLLMYGVQSLTSIHTNIQKLLELDMSIHFYPVSKRAFTQLEQNVHFFVFLPSLKISIRVPVDADYERIVSESALCNYLAINQVLYALITTIVMNHFESILLLLWALDRVNCSACALSYFPKDSIYNLSDFYLILKQHDRVDIR